MDYEREELLEEDTQQNVEVIDEGIVGEMTETNFCGVFCNPIFGKK